MMPAAKRASYFFSAPSIALPPSPRGSARSQESPGKDMPLACNGCKTATKQSATLTLIEGKRKAKMIAKGRFFCNQNRVIICVSGF